MSFLVLGLPRSRTAWLAKFLTYGDWYCGHEELRHMRSLDDVKAWFTQPNTGSAETAAAPFWRLLPGGLRIVTVRRPVADVVDSLMRLEGCTFDRAALETGMAALDRKLDQIEARLPVLSVRFDNLENESTCAEVFEHCLPYGHDKAHWARLAGVNVQCHMPGLMRYMAAYRGPLDKLAAQAKHRMLSEMALCEQVDPDGVTFQCESFDAWERDGGHLFAEHCVQVGETPEQWHTKNLPLMRRIDEMGAMQIMTARCNGKMFGYLMTLIAPSLVSENITSATNTTFFASPDVPGLGMKLQRAALAALKERGVDEVVWEAGHRGSGPRLGTMYRRMGAVEHGQTFRMELTEA